MNRIVQSVQPKKRYLKSDVFLSVALEFIVVNCCDSSLNSQSRHSTETKKTNNFNDFASSPITITIYSAERPQPVCAETAEKITEGAEPRYRHYALMNVCGDTLLGVSNSQASWTKLSVLHVQFSSSPLSKPLQ